MQPTSSDVHVPTTEWKKPVIDNSSDAGSVCKDDFELTYRPVDNLKTHLRKDEGDDPEELPKDPDPEISKVTKVSSGYALIDGADWQMDNGTENEEQALQDATENLLTDPDHYKRLRLDPVTKDTEEGSDSQFEGEGYNLDLGSGDLREPGHVGLDLYPYDYGTVVHDITTGLPFPSGSVSKVRMTNVPDVDPKAVMSEIQRVLMPGGQFHYEGPNDIWNYPEAIDDYPGMVLINHEDTCGDVQKGNEGVPQYRQKFERIAIPDAATANDAEPRVGIAQYDMLPADALLAMDATGYYWSDSTSSGRGNRLHGYMSQGAGIQKGHFKITKAAKQIVYGVVLTPDEIDLQDDYMTAEDIEKSAHEYMAKYRAAGENHKKSASAIPVESYIAPQDFEFDGVYGPQTVKKGSWVLAMKVLDKKIWEKIVNGDYQGFSVGGVGLRT